MSYQALYRSWRPQTFVDLVGQPHVRQTLLNAVTLEQVAHAYLFTGPRGTGKTSAAKILARAVNCTDRDGADPCNRCAACMSILSGSDVDVEEIDAASNRGVDEIRQLRDKVQYAPASLRRKVYIVDEVHMLTPEAFNALLKTLEEPPGHTLFILATTEPHKIPPTIISRCQRFDFRRIASEVIFERLLTVCKQEGWTYEDAALWTIAEASDGGLRDALGMLEQTAAYGRGEITDDHAAHVSGGVQSRVVLELVQALIDRDARRVMTDLMQWYSLGKDAARIIQDILHLLRDLLLVQLEATDNKPAAVREAFQATVARTSREWLLQSIQKLGEMYAQIRYVDQPRLLLEASLLGLMPVEAVRMPQTVPQVAPQVAQTAVPEVLGAKPPRSGSAAAPAADRDGAARETASARAAMSPARSSQRKREVLQTLSAEATPELLAQITQQWDDVLQEVRTQRIQTYGWLAHGQAVLATPDVIVLAFASRIHRDAVMKPDDRAVVEASLKHVYDRPLQILALVQSDWDEFIGPAAETVAPEGDLAARAIQIFGEPLVEIRDGE